MSALELVLLLIATFMTSLWGIFATVYEREFETIVDSIDNKLFYFSELFSIGFGIMKVLHINTKNEKARKRIKEIAEIRGKKYAEYYFYVIQGAKWTYGFTAFTFFSILGALAQSMLALILGGAVSGLLMWYLEELMNDQLEARRDELIADLPQMLSKLTLLINSGMILREAWEKVANGSQRVLYSEMQLAVQEMKNGVSEFEAFRNFADRCAVKEIRRFTSTLIQNLQKGNSELAYFLMEMTDEMWEEKKHLVKRKGEAANSKLLMPIAMIFIGILIMIIVPAFLNM